MSTIATKDGTQIYDKDWGKGHPIVFSHGWPLTADDWDRQLLFFEKHGYRVIATGITAYLKNSGKLEVAQQIANHESPRTTKLYDRRTDEISLDEIERITI